jgi:hypothetical protein
LGLGYEQGRLGLAKREEGERRSWATGALGPAELREGERGADRLFGWAGPRKSKERFSLFFFFRNAIKYKIL